MRIIIYHSQILMVFALAISTLSSKADFKPSRNGPAVHLADKTHNFGKVLIGNTVKHSFILTNVGTETLKILQLKHSCGCTSAGFDETIEPGKTGKVSIKLDTEGLDGKIQKSAYLFTNDPDNPKLEVMFICDVWSEVKASPNFAVFHPGTNEHDSRVIRITNFTEEPLIISDLRSADASFATSLREVKKGKIFELTIKTNTSKLTKMIQSSVSFHTSRKSTPVITIPVLVIPKQ